MKISEVIKKLQEIQEEHGDWNVTIDGFDIQGNDIRIMQDIKQVAIIF